MREQHLVDGVEALVASRLQKHRPPPPENELRRWLTLWRWAVKKRWCPVYEVLFRAGAQVRPDWRDDPHAFMVEEFRGPICGFTEGSGEL